MAKSYVGFGFGPIQSALFLLEAYKSGNFSRYVVGEIDAALVTAIRDNGGAYTIAGKTRGAGPTDRKPGSAFAACDSESRILGRQHNCRPN